FFFHYVPLYGALRCPTRALVMFLFAVPILGAEGLAWLAERVRTQRTTALVVAAVALVAAVAGAAWLARAGPAPPPLAPARHAFAHLVLVLGLGGALVALLVGGAVSAPRATLAVAVVSLVDLVVIARGSVQPKPADWAPGTERFAAVDWLFAKQPPGTLG